MPDLRYGTVAGFAAAAEEAHRRRTSSARAAALAVAAVVTMGGTANIVGRTDASGTLVPADPSPTVTAGVPVSPVPSATPRSAPSSVAPVAPAGPVARGPRVAGSPVGTPVAGVVVPSPAPRPSPVAAPPAARRPWSTPIARRTHAAELPCVQTDPARCFAAGAPVVTKDRVGVLATFCGPATEGYDLTFATDAEVEVWVTPSDDRDRVVWRSLADRPARPAPHTLSLGANGCVEWKTWWLRHGDDGRAVPSGTYTVWFRARSPQITSEPTMASFYL